MVVVKEEEEDGTGDTGKDNKNNMVYWLCKEVCVISAQGKLVK